MIQKEDVLSVANDLKINLTESQIDYVLTECNSTSEDDEPWYAMVENAIYNVIRN